MVLFGKRSRNGRVSRRQREISYQHLPMFEAYIVKWLIPRVELRGLEMLRSLELLRPWHLDLQTLHLRHQWITHIQEQFIFCTLNVKHLHWHVRTLTLVFFMFDFMIYNILCLIFHNILCEKLCSFTLLLTRKMARGKQSLPPGVSRNEFEEPTEMKWSAWLFYIRLD